MGDMFKDQKIRTTILQFLIPLVIFAVGLEIGSGYIFFQRDGKSKSAVVHALKKIAKRLRIKTNLRIANFSNPEIIKHMPQNKRWGADLGQVLPDLLMGSDESNPFLPKGENPGYKYHPFIDYSGVHVQHPETSKLDYFGFRNDRDYYFEREDCLLVVLTGGSESAGFSHKVTIAEHLEKMLLERLGYPTCVMNLSMNSYTTANEINAYVNLAFHLRPDFVISHSGSNDLGYGVLVPPLFRQLGLFYLKHMEYWRERLHHLNPAFDYPLTVNHRDLDDITKFYFENLKKYRSIVEANGGAFIGGIQGINWGDQNSIA